MAASNENKFVKHLFTRFKMLDLFATKIELKLNGFRNIGSIFGSSLSLIIYIVMICFSAYRVQVLVSRSNTNTVFANLVDFYPDSYTLNLNENNLMMAFGMTSTVLPYSDALDSNYLSLYVGLNVIKNGIIT